MRAFSRRWSPTVGWSEPSSPVSAEAVQLLLAFGPPTAPPVTWFEQVASLWPHARLVYTTAGGQIDRGEVLDDAVVVTGLAFDTVRVGVHSAAFEPSGGEVAPCHAFGRELGARIAATEGLRHVIVFADGLHVNGAAFTRGLGESLPEGITVSGGLASDGLEFVTTGVGLDAPPQPRSVVAVTFSGAALAVGTASLGGWEPFGPERLVTRARDATLFELDGERALDIYRRYLGPLAAELPGSALLFPLAVSAPGGRESVVRTILGIDEATGALRFAGDVPQGHKVRLMRATNDRLLDGAEAAARTAHEAMEGVAPQLVLCISCVGRRAVLRSRVEEEVDEVTLIAGGALVTGFYSNGEIAPPYGERGQRALFHNQTMTVTVFGER
jgi:hypothetical protein